MTQYTREERGRKLLYDLSQGSFGGAMAEIALGARLDMKDSTGATAIGIAAYSGMAGVVKTLVDHGADVDAADNEGCTPLMWAAAMGRTEVVDALLRAGAEPEARNTRGETALDMAKAEGQPMTANLLEDALIARRDSLREEWKDVAVRTESSVSISKPLKLKLGPRFLAL